MALAAALAAAAGHLSPVMELDLPSGRPVEERGRTAARPQHPAAAPPRPQLSENPYYREPAARGSAHPRSFRDRPLRRPVQLLTRPREHQAKQRDRRRVRIIAVGDPQRRWKRTASNRFTLNLRTRPHYDRHVEIVVAAISGKYSDAERASSLPSMCTGAQILCAKLALTQRARRESIVSTACTSTCKGHEGTGYIQCGAMRLARSAARAANGLWKSILLEVLTCVRINASSQDFVDLG